MERHKTRLLLAGVLCLALGIQTTCTPGIVWMVYDAAGIEAHQKGRYAEADQYLTVALKQAEKFGEQDARLATSLNNLASLYQDQGKYTQAEPLYKRALARREKVLRLDHPDVATTLEIYAELLRMTNRDAEAANLEARAQAIRAKHAQENPLN